MTDSYDHWDIYNRKRDLFIELKNSIDNMLYLVGTAHGLYNQHNIPVSEDMKRVQNKMCQELKLKLDTLTVGLLDFENDSPASLALKTEREEKAKIEQLRKQSKKEPKHKGDEN